jgi:hypothetical protein
MIGKLGWCVPAYGQVLHNPLFSQTKLLLSLTLIEMAEDRQQTAKESKGIRNRLKKAFGLGSLGTPSTFNRCYSTNRCPASIR